jgi:hypothetical protein
MTASMLSNGRHQGAFGMAGELDDRAVVRAMAGSKHSSALPSADAAVGEVFVTVTPCRGGCRFAAWWHCV